MLITESQRGFSRRNRYLTNIDFISEQAMSPEAVPIMESREYGAWMIDLEDVISFKESNGYSDLGDAFYTICECNDIDPDSTIFSVDEVSIIANEDSIGNLVTNLMNNGCAVVAKPVSSSLPLCMVGEACMDYGIYYDDWSLLEAWVTDDWDYLCEAFDAEGLKLAQEYLEIANKYASTGKPDDAKRAHNIRTLVTNMNKGTKITPVKLLKQRVAAQINRDFSKTGGSINVVTRKSPENIKDAVVDTKPGTATSFSQRMYDKRPNYPAMDTSSPEAQFNAGMSVDYGDGDDTKGTDNVEKAKEETKKLEQDFSNLKYKDINSVRRWIAVKLARLRQWAKNIDAEVKAKGDKAGMFAKVKAFIARGIAWLTQKLHNLAAGDKYSLKDDDKFDYDDYKKQREDYEKSDEYKNKK